MAWGTPESCVLGGFVALHYRALVVVHFVVLSASHCYPIESNWEDTDGRSSKAWVGCDLTRPNYSSAGRFCLESQHPAFLRTTTSTHVHTNFENRHTCETLPAARMKIQITNDCHQQIGLESIVQENVARYYQVTRSKLFERCSERI